MKKTIIAIFALAGVAMGETVTTTYTPFSSADDWELRGLGNARGEQVDVKKPTITNNTANSTNPNWCRPVGYYSFDTPLTLSNTADSLTFSFTLTGAEKNSVATIAFEGSDGSGARSLVMGSCYRGQDGVSNNNFAFGSINKNDGNAYLLGSDGDWQGKAYNITPITLLGGITENAVTFSGSIAWDEQKNGFMFTLTQGNSTASYNLGANYTLTSLNLTFDGGNTNNNSYTFSDFTISHKSIPEPTTATLSLLALAGLAMRRRRR